MPYYLWIKAFHLISLVAWFAVLFYLPRLFVYHAENRDKADFVAVVKVMQRKLIKVIGIPAFVFTLITGVTLVILNPALLKAGWFHAKMTLLVFLIAYFFHAIAMHKQLLTDQCQKSGKFFRMYNEIPTLFLMSIVLLAVLKPF